MTSRKRAAGTEPTSTEPGQRARGTTDFSPDDGLRGQLAVVASLVKRPDGTVRVVLDDAKRGRDGAWRTTGLITSRDFPKAILEEMPLDRDELENIGLVVAARLIAFEQTERSGG